ncbi:MAG: PHP domain-containing protein [Planctomycetes bacterium]|nr:PHP domain-containing protein [Planctomycetota bacterium]MCC7169299.1 PHP domain-containing protein [Planctomycetota bacterium]
MLDLIGSSCVVLCAILGQPPIQDGVDGRVLHANLVHLGDSEKSDWKDLRLPTATTLQFEFDAERNPRPCVLSIVSADVSDDWSVVLNGKVVASLAREVERAARLYELPERSLADGTNTLLVRSERGTDDILVGDVRLQAGSIRELKKLAALDVVVLDADSREPLPARITVLDGSGQRTPLWYATSPATAVRTGVTYTKGGVAHIEAAAGALTIVATRGMEWSLARREVTLAVGARERVELLLRREVDTRGHVAADTHVHTLTFSGHGDSSVEERQITLAGEGVEFAVATDHNHHTDYVPTQRSLGLSAYYTTITGNEVTTDVGHFNSFPFEPGAQRAEYRGDDWTKLVAGIRERGAQVVILNHPRWPAVATGPFGRYRLDPATGTLTGQTFCADATELVNSTQLLDDPLLLFRDWFALLNGGVRVFAVGSSDSHTVDDPVGQGRTYVRSTTDDPTAIDVDATCEALRNGKTSIALGLFTTIRVNEAASSGDVLRRASGETVEARIRVASAHWFTPRELVVFLNGKAVERRALDATPGRAFDATTTLSMPWPEHDAWLVAVALGGGSGGSWWPMQQDYSLGATNPVFLDADGDGAWSSPRQTATALASRWNGGAAALIALVRGLDDATAIHLVDVARTHAAWSPELIDAIETAAAGREELLAFLSRSRAAANAPTK